MKAKEFAKRLKNAVWPELPSIQNDWSHDIKKVDTISREKAEWVEKQVLENLKFHLDCGDRLRSEAHKVMAVVILVLSASIGGLIKGSPDQSPEIRYILVAVSSYFTILAGFLILFGLGSRSHAALGNEPKNLLTQSMFDFDLQAMIVSQAQIMQLTIDSVRRLNADRGRAINLTILGIATTPVLLTIVYGGLLLFY